MKTALSILTLVLFLYLTVFIQNVGNLHTLVLSKPLSFHYARITRVDVPWWTHL